MLKQHKKLSIMNRLLINYLFAVVCLLIISLTFLYVSFWMHERKICQEAVEKLQRVSDMIELELKSVEKSMSNIITNINIQRQLIYLYNSQSQYEREATSHAIKQAMNTFLYEIGNKGIDCIMFTHIHGTDFREELLINPIDTDNLNLVNDMLLEYFNDTELYAWLLPSKDLPFLIFARAVRSYSVSQNENVGILGVLLTPRTFISRTFGIDDYTKEKFYIVGKDDQPIYGDDEIRWTELKQSPWSMDDSTQQSALKSQEKYEYLIEYIDGVKYLASVSISNYTGWKYVKLTPYRELMAGVTSTQIIMIVSFLLTIFIILIFGVNQIRNITVPVERLSQNIQKLGSGGNILSHGIPNNSFNDKDIKDASLLEREFYLLVEKINNLITSNYDKQIALKEWELRALRAQINPHFLYNTLGTVSWLATTNRQNQIPDIVMALANLLRGSISQNNFAIVEHECNILKSYITIQQVRYKERLTFSMDIDDDIMNCLVPCMILQPLTENTIRHVLEESQMQCDIHVYSCMHDEYFELIHSDNGRSDFVRAFNNGNLISKGTGIGLKNIDSRIKNLCGEEYGIIIKTLEHEQGTKVILRLPYGYDENDFC